jgi:hypothetical protein
MDKDVPVSIATVTLHNMMCKGGRFGSSITNRYQDRPAAES